MRISVAVAVVSLSLAGISAADEVRAAIKKPTNIPAQSLGIALQALAKERSFQIVYFPEEVNALKTQGAVGELTADEALARLLMGTGLSYRYLDERTVTVFPLPAGGRSALIPETGEAAQEEGSSVPSATARAIGDEPESKVEEVIVTAQKRAERLQDVPVPVTVLSGDKLADGNLLQIREYASTVPGLNVTPYGQGQTFLAIRGVTSGSATNPTVGVTVDDVPFGGSIVATNGTTTPDFDPNDLESIEVLRGPQGTLYGANSMGGLIKYVTKEPSMDRFSGRMQAGINAVHNGDEPGYSREPDEFAKLGIGCLIFGIGMLWLAAANGLEGVDGKVPLGWALLFHVVVNIGCVYFSPIALALFSRAAPAAVNSMMVGVYYLAIFAGSIVSGRLGGLYEQLSASRFWLLHAAVVGTGGVLILLLAPIFRRELTREPTMRTVEH